MTIPGGDAITIEQARKIARRLFEQVAEGIDPIEERERKRLRRLQDRTISEICSSYMEKARAGLILYRGRPKKKSTLDIDQGRIDRHIVPIIGRKKISTIERWHVEKLRDAIVIGKTAATVRTKPRGLARVTGGPEAANRVVDLLGSIMSFAVREGLRKENPVDGVERIRGNKVGRALRPDEYRCFFDTCDEMEKEGANPLALLSFRVMALTGYRPGEVRNLRQNEIDHKRQVVRFGDTKTGAQVRPIGLTALKFLPENTNSAWIFPSKSGNGPITDHKLFQKVCARAGLIGITPKVFRHSFISTAQSDCSLSEAIAAAMVGHKKHTTTAGYTHVDHYISAAADRVSSKILDYISGNQVTNVVRVNG